MACAAAGRKVNQRLLREPSSVASSHAIGEVVLVVQVTFFRIWGGDQESALTSDFNDA